MTENPASTLAVGLVQVARATPAEQRSMDRWSLMLRADAMVSGAYVVSVNRAGREGEMGFAGHSVVVAPDGEVLKDLGPEPATAVVTLDLALARAAKHDYSVLIDREDWV